MKTAPLQAKILTSSNPRLLVALCEREALKSIQGIVVESLARQRGGVWIHLTKLYRVHAARGRSGAPRRFVQSLAGVFDDGGRVEDYAQFSGCTPEEAVYIGGLLISEHLRSILFHIEEQFSEAVAGPSDDLAFEVDEGSAIVEAVLVALAIRIFNAGQEVINAVMDEFITEFQTEAIHQLVDAELIGETVACVIATPKAAFPTLNHSIFKVAADGGVNAMYMESLGETLNHLISPEIRESRFDPALASSPDSAHAEPPTLLPGLGAALEGGAPSMGEKKGTFGS